MPEDWLEHRSLSDTSIVGPHARLLLEPLTRAHAADFHAAADSDVEAFQNMSYDPPESPDQAAAVIDRLNAPDDQLPYAQLVAATGEFVGTTSFYEINPAHRSLAIGHTWIGRKWWQSWVNTTSKLIMLSRAFDELGAERVVWHTDIRNTQSQQAIRRLGAAQEGVLRHHRPRRDGSWRDTVQYSMLSEDWPVARQQLIGRLSDAGAGADA